MSSIKMNQHCHARAALTLLVMLAIVITPSWLTAGATTLQQFGGRNPGLTQPPGFSQFGGRLGGQMGGQYNGYAPSQFPKMPTSQGTFGQPQLGFDTQGSPFSGQGKFSSIWSVPTTPKAPGFPGFPSSLPGYGNYPLPINPLTGASPIGGNQSDAFTLPLAPAEPAPTGWPSWIRAEAKRPLPYAIDVGLLISQSGRIWHRGSELEPFEPILVHDKFASLPIAGEVETRSAGSFELLLHDSTRVQSRGLTKMKVNNLDEQQVHLTFTQLSWLRLSSAGRTNRFSLPDGSSVELEDSSNGDGFSGLLGMLGMPAPADMMRPPLLEIRRINEPSWYGGRATMTNFGGSDIIWRHAFGTTIIKPDHRVTLFLSPPQQPTAASLTPGDSRVERDGDKVTCRSNKMTDVEWCGAKIRLPKGARVTFESSGVSLATSKQVAADKIGG